MANIKLDNENKESLLLDWKNSVTNRGDVLYFIKEDVNLVELERLAFSIGVIIKVENHSNALLKVILVDLLN